MKKWGLAHRLGVVLAVLLIGVLLCACGEKDLATGRYVCVERWSGRIPLQAADGSLQLGAAGFGKLTLEGESGLVTWSREGTGLRVTVGAETYLGAVGDGVIRLAGPEELTLVFAREEKAAEYREEQAARREVLGLWQTQLAGDWYGWWRIENNEGQLADTWYDLCGTLEAQPDGGLYLRLWDEDASAEEPIAEALLYRTEDGGAEAEEGFFWLQTLGGSGWTLRLEDGSLRLAARHDAEGERFDYTLCLRRWGEEWPENGDERPYYYTDWYLPLIGAGETMPARMEIEK